MRSMTQNHNDQETLTFAGCKPMHTRHGTRIREAGKMAKNQGPSSSALMLVLLVWSRSSRFTAQVQAFHACSKVMPPSDSCVYVYWHLTQE